MQYKKIIVRIILLSAVIAGVTDLFSVNPDALWAMVAVYFCIPLASLTLTTSSKARIAVIATIITILLLLVSRFKVYGLISVAVFIGGTAYCLIQHNIRIHRRKEFTVRSLSYIHSGIFALVCAIAGTFSIMSKPGIFNTITCDQVRGVVNQHLSTILTPLRFTEDQIDIVQKRTDTFFTQTPEQVVQEQVMGQLSTNSAITDILPANITQQLGTQGVQDMQKMVNDMLKNSNGSQVDLSTIKLPANLSIKDKLMAKEMLKNANLNKQVPTLIIGKNTPADTTPPLQQQNTQPTQQETSSASSSLFNGLLTTPLDNKQQLDEKICDVVFGQIKERSTKPGFKISILLSLIFFLYPLVRLIAFVYSIILSIIYLILRQTGFISVIPEERIVDTWTIGDGYEPQTLLARMAFANTDKTPKSERVAKVIATQEIARNATPPTLNTNQKKGSTVNDIMGDMEQLGGGTGARGDNHIITANSPQDTNEAEPPQPKKDTGPHIDFGSFGGNFGQKFKNE